MWLLDLAGIAGGAVLAAICLRQVALLRRLRNLSPELGLLLGTAGALFVLHLLYQQIYDIYIIPFIPFGLLAFARNNDTNPARPAASAWSIAISATLIFAFSFYIRGKDAQIEAEWNAGERLVVAGIPSKDISTFHNDVAWHGYHGAFDQWIDAGEPGFLTATSGPIPRIYAGISGRFFDWLRERSSKAPYVVLSGTPGDRLPADWQILATDPYRDAVFRKRVTWTIRRPAQQ